jgi:ribosomal protein L9
MAKVEVILTHNLPGLGGESDQVQVAAGYARNYLIPQGLGDPAHGGQQAASGGIGAASGGARGARAELDERPVEEPFEAGPGLEGQDG